MTHVPQSRLVSRVFDYDGGRPVTVYVPSAPAEAIVYAGDGQLIAPWGDLLHSPDVTPTMIVGVHRASAESETVRLCEYSPGFDPEIFSAHERFFTEEVPGWFRDQLGVDLPRDRTAICGVSASGELALALGIRHPETYGYVFSMSPGGGHRPPVHLPANIPSVYLTAGTREPFFLENAHRWAAALREGGATVKMTERDGDHGDSFWEDEFPRMVAWAFSR